jgi:hypothetical protein
MAWITANTYVKTPEDSNDFAHGVLALLSEHPETALIVKLQEDGDRMLQNIY